MGIVLVIQIVGWYGMAGQSYGMWRKTMVNPKYKKLVIPYVVPSLNETNTWHWAKKAREKKQVEADVYFLVRHRRLLPDYPHVKVKIRISYYFGTVRRRDIVDNYNPKFLMDGLVKSGMLADDNSDMVGIPELCSSLDKANPRTEVEIWILEGDGDGKEYQAKREQAEIKKLQKRQEAKHKKANAGATTQAKASNKKPNKKTGGCNQ